MLPWRLARFSLQKRLFVPDIKHCLVLRTISTSEKNRDVAVTTQGTSVLTGKKKSKTTWQTYGFGLTKEEDFAHMHLTFFFGVTVSIVMISFYIAYAPSTIDWEQREAFLELRRREKSGLPLVDPNYIDPSQVELPPDEDYEDSDILL